MKQFQMKLPQSLNARQFPETQNQINYIYINKSNTQKKKKKKKKKKIKK